MIPLKLLNNSFVSTFRSHQVDHSANDELDRVLGKTSSNLNNPSLGLFEKDGERIKKRFTHSWTIMKSINPLNNEWTLRLLLLSDISNKKKAIRGLFLRWLFSELSETEEHVFLLEATDSAEYLAAVKASMKIPKILVAARLNAFLRFSGKQEFPFREFLSQRNLLITAVTDKQFAPPRPVIKYTGWRRHQNDQGCLNTASRVDPLPIESRPSFEEYNSLIEEVLSVGTLPKSKAEGPLMMALKNAETERFNNFVEQFLKEYKLCTIQPL